MKKNMMIGIAMAMGIFSMGAISASAADSNDKCVDQQSIQQFTQETAALSSTLKAKNLELGQLYAYNNIDIEKANDVEDEIKELKSKINASAKKHGITACSRS